MNSQEGTALKKSISDVFTVALLLPVLALLIQILFYKGNVIDNMLFSLSLWWLFLPGILLLWSLGVGGLEQLTIGSIIGAASSGMLMYYVGLFGVPISLAAWLCPLLLDGAVFLHTRLAKKARKQPPKKHEEKE
jgi:hypothetical protein